MPEPGRRGARAPALAALLLALWAGPAAALGAGESLPPLSVESPGEILLEGDGTRFAPWSSERLRGTVQVVQYLAARPASREANKPFTDRLEASGIPLSHYHVTTIVNLDEAVFGTGGFVMSELEKNKRRYHLSTIVADGKGSGRGAWGLAPKSSAVIVLDAGGRVRFFREGTLTPEEIEQALALVREGAPAAPAAR